MYRNLPGELNIIHGKKLNGKVFKLSLELSDGDEMEIIHILSSKVERVAVPETITISVGSRAVKRMEEPV